MTRDEEFKMEDVRLIWRNFEGREGLYNDFGKRNFSIVLDEMEALEMIEAGWAVKRKDPKEEGDLPLYHLPVKVNFRSKRPPILVMISSKGRTNLDETTCALIDFAELLKVDLILNPYHWDVSGKQGIKAYLKKVYVTIYEDFLDLKYADVPDAVSYNEEEEDDEE